MKKFIEAMFFGGLVAYGISVLFSVDLGIIGFFCCGLIGRYIAGKLDTNNTHKNKHFAN